MEKRFATQSDSQPPLSGRHAAATFARRALPVFLPTGRAIFSKCLTGVIAVPPRSRICEGGDPHIRMARPTSAAPLRDGSRRSWQLPTRGRSASRQAVDVEPLHLTVGRASRCLAVRTAKRWRPVDGRRGNHANLAASCRDGCQMAANAPGDRPSSCREADRRVYTSV